MREEYSDERLQMDTSAQSTVSDGVNASYRSNSNQQMDEINITQRNVHNINCANQIWSDTQHEQRCYDDCVYYVYEIGVYGVRRLILYSVLTVIIISIIINVILTVWITTLINFTSEGISSLNVYTERAKYGGYSVFSRDVHVKYIASENTRTRIASEKAIALNGRINENLSSRVNIEQRTVAAQCNQMLFRACNEADLMNLNDDNVFLTADKLRVQNHGVYINGSAQCPLIKSATSDELKLESLTRRVRLKSSKTMNLLSNQGDGFVKSSKKLTLKSKTKSLNLQTMRLDLRDLKTALPTRRGRTYPDIYQLCCCGNGKLFLSLPDGRCQFTANVCGTKRENKESQVSNRHI